MASGISVQLGEVEVTVLPTHVLNSTTPVNSSLFDQLLLLFPGTGGVGEIYHGSHEGAVIPPSSITTPDFSGVTPGVLVGVGGVEGPGVMDVGGGEAATGGGYGGSSRHFGAEEVSTIFFFF